MRILSVVKNSTYGACECGCNCALTFLKRGYPIVSILEGGFVSLRQLLSNDGSPYDPSSALVSFEEYSSSSSSDYAGSGDAAGTDGSKEGAGANFMSSMSASLGSSKSWLSGATKGTPSLSAGLGSMKMNTSKKTSNIPPLTTCHKSTAMKESKQKGDGHRGNC